MKLDGKPSNVLTRSHWWSDDAPPWLTRLAHYTCCWLVFGSILFLLNLWTGRAPVERSHEWLTITAVTGGVAYGVGLAVYQVRRRLSAHRSRAAGA